MSWWVREVVGLLAGQAPRLDRALKKIALSGGGQLRETRFGRASPPVNSAV